MSACSDGSQPVRNAGAGDAAFCATLENIRTHPNPLSANPNELAAHTDNLKSLFENAPDEIAPDLLALHDIFAQTRDAEDTDTLKGFQALTDTNIAGYEGRVAKYAAQFCKIIDGDISYEIDPDYQPVTLCPGWPSAGSPLTNNQFPYLLDTSSANYFSAIFFSGPLGQQRNGLINVPRGGKVTIKGEYPYARYFGFHPNDMATNNLQTLMDTDIDPDPGSKNPWREPLETGQERRYTVHFVADSPPEAPQLNTAYIGAKKSGGKNYATFLIYRVYGAELPALPPNSAGVKLPSVTVYDKAGKEIEHHPECEPYPPGAEPPIDRTKFPAFPVPDHRAQAMAGTFNVKGNFGLEVDLLSNADVLYLSAFYGRNHGEVFAIRGKKPKTVDPESGLFPWSDGLDFRMWTACTYNFWNGAANDCVVDADMATDEDGHYTLVISEPHFRPQNAIKDNGVTWLDAGNFLDGQISFRMVPKPAPALKTLKMSIERQDGSSPFDPAAAFCSQSTFEAGGFDACYAAGRTSLD